MFLEPHCWMKWRRRTRRHSAYEVKFITAGTYQLFTRHSMYDSDGNGNFGNEDSIYLSPAFNKNSSTDWVGFQGVDFDENDARCRHP